MVVRWDVNAFKEVSHNDKRHGEKFTSNKMDNRIFFSRHSISFLCKPRPRRPLEGYVRRTNSLQYEPWKIQNFHKIYIQPVSQTKYGNSSKNKELMENSLAESRKNCWLSQIHQTRKRFSNLLSISSLPRILVSVIIGIILGLIFLYITKKSTNGKKNIV